jgi:hypothetical protein
MNRRLVLAFACASSACACLAFVPAPSWAQATAKVAAPAALPPSPAPAASTRLLPTSTFDTVGPNERSEPNVTHSVIEDKGSKIDQLTVRGQVQHVVVTPKVGLTTPYEILVGPEGRDPYGGGTGGARSAAGNRVWNVLKF